MLESQIDQQERRETLRNDLKVQGSTFHQFAEADAATPHGRFSQVNFATAIGSKAGIASAYPAASGPWHGPDLVGLEPPLGHSVDDLEPSSAVSPSASAEATGDADAPSTPLAVEPASPPSSGDPASARREETEGTSTGAVGSPPYRRTR